MICHDVDQSDQAKFDGANGRYVVVFVCITD